MPSGHTLALALRAAYLSLHRQTDAHLSCGGATADQFVVLSALMDASPATQQELVRRTSSDPNTLRAMLVLLERKGLVRRDPHPTDRRARSVVLTEEGRRAYDELWSLGEPVRARLLCALRPEEVKALTALLDRIAETMSDRSV
jgi:DNA-binding MarR family transcriptional regulator